MPIDSQIALQSQGLGPLVNPLQIQQQVQQQQLARQQAAALEEQRKSLALERQQTTEKLARENAARTAFGQALQQGQGIREASRHAAMTLNPDALPMVDDYFDKVETSAAAIKDKQAQIDKINNGLNDDYNNHIGHAMDFALNYAKGDPEKLHDALTMTAADYAQRFPKEAPRAAQVFQTLTSLPPQEMQSRMEQARAASPYYQAIETKQAEQGPHVVGEALVGPTGNVLYQGEPKTSYQSKDVMLDGKRAVANFDPHTGKYTDATSGQDVSARVTPIPPASLVLNDQRNQPIQLPTWALDASRPTGASANQVDPVIKKTPNGLYQDAITWMQNGQYPPMGRGNDPTAIAQRAAIDAKVGAMAADAGMDVPSFRATYNANKSSLGQMQKSSDSVQAFLSTADKNTALLEGVLSKIPDIGSPVFNRPLRAFASQVQGDPNLSQFYTYLTSVQNEYAKILTNPNLSGQLTDASRKDAQTLVNGSATIPQILAALKALRAEGGNRMQSLGDQIKTIQGRIGGPQQPSSAAGVEEWVRDPATGKLVKKGGG